MMLEKLTIACFCIVFLYMISTPGEASNYFKCKDENGNIIFSDTECPDESEILTEKTVRPGSFTGRFSSDAYQDGSNMSLQDMLQLRQKLGEALTAITPIKIMMADYYLQQQEWPEKLEALGFDPRQTNSEQIDSIKIGEEGAVIARLRESLGTNKMIILSPHEAMDGTLIEWDCAANFSPLLMNDLSCESRKIHP